MRFGTIEEQLPGQPEAVASALEAARYAVAVLTRRGLHGQLCPVWTHLATVDHCDCWILPMAARQALAALTAADTWAARGEAT